MPSHHETKCYRSASEPAAWCSVANWKMNALVFLAEAKLLKKLSVCSVPVTLILTLPCASWRGHALCPEPYLKNLKRCPLVDEILSVFITAAGDEWTGWYTVIYSNTRGSSWAVEIFGVIIFHLKPWYSIYQGIHTYWPGGVNVSPLRYQHLNKVKKFSSV